MQKTPKTILVVDDSQSQRQLVAGYLKQFNFRVATARNGTEALTKIQDLQPDLLILDVVMPQMNGYEVCRQVKRHPETENTQIIFFSSNATESDRYWGLKLGADAYVSKPCKPQALLDVVYAVLEP